MARRALGAPAAQGSRRLKALRLAGGALVLLAFVVTGLEARYLLESVRLVQHGVKAAGVVVENAPAGDDTFPVVAWSDAEGRAHRLRSRVGQHFDVGTRLALVYLPGEELARIDSPTALWLPLLYVVPVWAVLGAPGFLLLWLGLPKDSPGAEAA